MGKGWTEACGQIGEGRTETCGRMERNGLNTQHRETILSCHLTFG